MGKGFSAEQGSRRMKLQRKWPEFLHGRQELSDSSTAYCGGKARRPKEKTLKPRWKM